MPFGLRDAGTTFVRALTSILQPWQPFAGSYVDDMVVGSGDWSTHMSHLRLFLETIHEAGLTMNLAKCVCPGRGATFGASCWSGIKRQSHSV